MRGGVKTKSRREARIIHLLIRENTEEKLIKQEISHNKSESL
jgi:hypothetical protein